MIVPIVQLVILGYAFGGNVKHLKVGVVDQDHSVPAVRVRELANAVAAGARTFDTIDYSDQGQALTDLRNGRINGVLTIPPEFSRKTLERAEPRIALIEDNTDNFVAVTLAATLNGLVGRLQSAGRHHPAAVERGDARRGRGLSLRALPAVSAAGLDRDVDLHDGDDRRRHHLHRRQGAGAARRLSRDAGHQVRADCRLQPVGHDQGGARRLRADDARLAHRRHSRSVCADAARSVCSS